MKRNASIVESEQSLGLHALNALSASTEAGWMVNFIVSLKICRALKSVKLISNVTFLSG